VPVTTARGAATILVRVVPRAGRTRVAGTRGDALVVRLAAPPVDGAANDALIAALAELFGRPRRDIEIVSGLSSRDKRVRISGLSAADAAGRIDAALASSASRR
jgi:uncharacterized protein (TIGR00251 family)